MSENNELPPMRERFRLTQRIGETKCCRVGQSELNPYLKKGRSDRLKSLPSPRYVLGIVREHEKFMAIQLKGFRVAKGPQDGHSV